MIKITPDKRSAIIVISISCISLVLIPIIITFSILGTFYNPSEEFLLKFKLIMIFNIIFGFLIILNIATAYYYPEFSYKRTLFFIVGECIYIANLFNISQIGRLEIETVNFSFYYDISVFFLVTIGIPILLIIRTVFNLKVKRESWFKYFLILDMINNKPNINSRNQLNKRLRSSNLQSNILKDLLQKSGNYLSYFEKNNFVEHLGNYILTKKGHKYLLAYRKIKKYNNFFLIKNQNL